MRKNCLILYISFLCKFSIAQIDSSDYRDHSIYLYETEEDFFSKEKVYRGQYIPTEDTEIIKYVTLNLKKRSLNLEDSCNYYFGYEIGDEIRIRPTKDPANFTYYVFGGGTKDLYCVAYGRLPNYDRSGYLLGLTSPTSFVHLYFVDKINKHNMVQLTEFLSSSPKLLEKYKAEKAKSTKEDWEQNKLVIGIKYLKLVIAEHK